MNSMDTLEKLTQFFAQQHTGFTTAGDQEYLQAIKKVLTKEKSEPSSEMIRFLLNQVYSGRQTQEIIDRFAPLTKEAFRQFIDEQVVDCLQRLVSMERDGTAKSDAVRYSPHNKSITNEEFEEFFVVTVV